MIRPEGAEGQLDSVYDDHEAYDRIHQLAHCLDEPRVSGRPLRTDHSVVVVEACGTPTDAFHLATSLGAFVLTAFVVFLVFAEPDQRNRALLHLGTALRLLARWALNLLLLAWVLVSWRRVTRNLGLAYADKHAIKRVRRVRRSGEITERERPKITYPWVLARPDPYGVVLTVWTRASVGRADFDKVVDYLADTGRCRRVHVEQRKPGRITVRALRRDPLDTRLSPARPRPRDGPPDPRRR